MPDEVLRVRVNGRQLSVPRGTSAAAAITLAGEWRFRTSVSGQPRGPLCGMGICFECKATIDGHISRRTCQLPVHEGMDIQTS